MTAERLPEKRYVVSGDRAYLVGAGDGRFPAMGWHIRGEMGGLWAPPIKLLDGYWFTLDGRPLPPAASLHVHPAHVELVYPAVGSVALTRTEVAPDGMPAVLVGMTLRNHSDRTRLVRVGASFRSKLLASYPWTHTRPLGAADLRGEDVARVEGDSTIVFERPDTGWCALVRPSIAPAAVSVASPGNAAAVDPAALDGGAWGAYEWSLRPSSDDAITLWIALAGSHRSFVEADAALRLALARPPRLLTAKTATRRRLLRQSRIVGPTRELAAAFDVAKLNLADLRRVVPDAHVRDVTGARLGEPVDGPVELRGIGAGFPDYAHFFGGDACYAAYGLVASGQWETAMEHLRLLRDVSRAVNGDTGKVVHEVAFDGSVCYGSNLDVGDVDETPLVATAVELLWRWSGDGRFRDEMYGFVRDGMRYVVDTLDADGDGYPAGEGGTERGGAGEETLAVCVWTREGLRALERLARSRGDTVTAAWASAKAARLEVSFDRDWWIPAESLYADSLDEDNRPLLQRHWICALPMALGMAPVEHALAAFRRLESDAFTGPAGLFHTGGDGTSNGCDRRVWTVSNAVMAVAEANYGRVEQALRYMRPIAEGIDLEMPGALPEVLPSPGHDVFGDLHDRLMFMQAWSAYGVQWPIVHHLLGVRPDAPGRRLTVIPSLPPTWSRLSVGALRVGDGTISVTARRNRGSYTTHVDAPAGWRLTLGHRLSGDVRVRAVDLDGTEVPFELVESPEGRAICVSAESGVHSTLEVTVW